MKKRSPQLNRAVGYIRGKLRRKTWCIGESIDSISSISRSIKVSRETVTKAVSILEYSGLLENRGRDGIWVTGKMTERMSTVLKLSNIQGNFTAAKMLEEGGIFDKKHQAILLRKSNSLEIFFPLTGKKETLTLAAIRRIKSQIITVEGLLKHTEVSNKDIKKYKDQIKVLSLIEVIIPHKKELNLDV